LEKEKEKMKIHPAKRQPRRPMYKNQTRITTAMIRLMIYQTDPTRDQASFLKNQLLRTVNLN
jgi:hypothetical protein